MQTIDSYVFSIIFTKMKNKYLILLILFVSGFFYSCQDVIEKDIRKGVSQLVVDAFINNLEEEQKITLTLSQPYFDNSKPIPALGANVIVFDEDSIAHQFVDLQKNGVYVWKPNTRQKALNKIGKRYVLYINYDGQEYVSLSELKRVPKIDSLNYFVDTLAIRPQNGSQYGFTAEFFARDFQGEGDCYQVKTARNGKYKKANNITLAYDGAFSPGSKSDGIIFILPIRRSVNPDTLALLQEKDTLQVDLYSITQETYFFMNLVRQESTNQGLFAVPSVNIPSNVVNRDEKSTKKPLGFFSISAISRFKTVIDKSKAVKKPNI